MDRFVYETSMQSETVTVDKTEYGNLIGTGQKHNSQI